MVDVNDANDADITYIVVAGTVATGTVHPYAYSEVIGMNALQQKTEWGCEDVSSSFNLDWLR